MTDLTTVRDQAIRLLVADGRAIDHGQALDILTARGEAAEWAWCMAVSVIVQPEDIAEAEEEAHAEHSRRTRPSVAQVIDRMSESDRRAVLDFVIGQGRYLDAEDEWTMDDNFNTTESLVAVYSQHVIPHEAPQH